MYVVYDPEKGFLCEDEDSIGGDSHSFDLDEYTVKFSDLDNAKRYCELNEFILKIVS